MSPRLKSSRGTYRLQRQYVFALKEYCSSSLRKGGFICLRLIEREPVWLGMRGLCEMYTNRIWRWRCAHVETMKWANYSRQSTVGIISQSACTTERLWPLMENKISTESCICPLQRRTSPRSIGKVPCGPTAERAAGPFGHVRVSGYKRLFSVKKTFNFCSFIRLQPTFHVPLYRT